MSATRTGPPPAARAIGQATCALVALAPGAWPLIAPGVRRFWDRMAPRWDSGRSPARTVPLAAACERVAPPPARILEIGTGTGDGAAVLAARFPEAEITACDLSPEMIRAARAKAPPRVDFEVADASALPFPDASFDLVAQLNMPVFAGELARVLRPGGHAIVASTFGARTPYHTPEPLLRRALERHGLAPEPLARAGEGTYSIARRRGG